ncbi:sensor histidine kinase [Cohnella cholangitidis]|uniref:histidine kinase n=1 Tax=Cohnella cholangitidis TaxID=2598458 RepID=A0A7G5C407_9BACL|nr:sensor histidine kinase [Cohnella cholangitidis]QMV43941.1 sensor histidine kinase [Cohnella cholangitidis]
MKRWIAELQKIVKLPVKRMESKLFTVFLFLIILPMGILSYLSSERYQGSIEKNTVTYVSQVSDIVISKLDDYMEDMKKISIIPSYVDNIMDNLVLSNEYYERLSKEEPDSGARLPEGEEVMEMEQAPIMQPEDGYERFGIGGKIRDSIYFLNTIKQGTNTVYLFDQYDHPYYVVRGGGVRNDLEAVYPKWKTLATEAHGRPVLVSTQEVLGANQSGQFVFTVVRAIIGPTYEQIGMIAIDANISVIEKFVKDLDEDTHGTTLIIDEEGRVVFDSEKKYLGQNFKENELFIQAHGQEGSFHGNLNGQGILTIYKQSPKTGWKILITIPESQLTKEAVKTRNITEWTAVAIIGFALVISLVLILALTQPLRSLVRLMKEVQNGNLDVVFPVRQRDEIGLVGNAFNRMIVRIKSLVDDVYIVGQRKKEAEIEALQNQINPHFIYNTLEAIRMTAVINDDSEVSDMAMLLGKLLRYSIGSGMETATLTQELNHLEMYIQLLNYRYSNKFTFDFPNKPMNSNMPLMKLLFQPIVENSVYHGMDESKRGMEIRMDYSLEEGNHVFTIEDNGIGMSQEALFRLRSRLDGSVTEERGRGIGLRNVHERLKLRYGEMYGITVESEKGKGTKVIIRFPENPKEGVLLHG